MRYAVANGNWSSVATWDGGASIPASDQEVHANGFTVTLDQDITVVRISTRANGAAAAGGGFTCSVAGRVINAHIQAGTSDCLTLTHATGTVTINGNVVGGDNSNCDGILQNGAAGATVINGNVTGGTGTSNPHGFNHIGASGPFTIVGDVTGMYGNGVSTTSTGTGTNTITGNIYASPVSNVDGLARGSAATQNITVNGNIYGGPVTGAEGAVFNGAGGNCVVNGNIYGGEGDGTGANWTATAGTLVINGDIIGRGAAGLPITSATGMPYTVNGDLYGSDVNNGATAVTLTNDAEITVNGNVYGGEAGVTAYGLSSNTSGPITINGRAVASKIGAPGFNISGGAGSFFCRVAVANDFPCNGSIAGAPGVNNAAIASTCTIAAMEFGAGGQSPVAGRIYMEPDGETNYVKMRPSNGGDIYVLGELAPDYPAEADVRLGVNYNSAGNTGSMAVPAASLVAPDVPVGAAVGTAAWTEQRMADAIGPLLAAG